MTPEEQATIKENLRQVAEILYKNTPSTELTRFETIELTVREHIMETGGPEIGDLSWCAFPCIELCDVNTKLCGACTHRIGV